MAAIQYKWSSKIDTKDNALVYNLVVDDIQNNNSIALHFYYWKSARQYRNYTLQLKDLKDKERYLISGTLKASAGNNELCLDEKATANYESWKWILITSFWRKVYANNFELSKAQSSISIQSQSEQTNSLWQLTSRF
jgi:hypothetical protein